MTSTDYRALVDKLVAMPHDARKRWLANCASSIDVGRLIDTFAKRSRRDPAVRGALLQFARDTGDPPPSSVVDVLGDIARGNNL